jgi:hypothetical protein
MVQTDLWTNDKHAMSVEQPTSSPSSYRVDIQLWRLDDD